MRAAPALPAIKAKTFSDLSQLNLATKDAAKPANPWAAELEALLPRNFLAVIPFGQLRAVAALSQGAGHAHGARPAEPGKDRERAQMLAPYSPS